MLLIYCSFLLGIIRYRFIAYWKWVYILLVWQIVGPFLFAGGGNLDNPAGDGLITYQLRVASSNGPIVGFVGILFLVVYYVGIIYFIRRMYVTVKERLAPTAEADATPTPRKTIEVAALTATMCVLSYWQFADRFSESPVTTTENAPAETSDNAGPEIDPIAQQLALVAAQITAEGSKKIDPITTLASASSQGRTLIYHYELSRRDASDDDLLAVLRRVTLPKVCHNAEMRREMDDYGITYRYSYRLPNSQKALDFDVTSETCRTAKP